MSNKYVVIGQFVRPHKDCGGECTSPLDYDEAMKVYAQWNSRPRKYKSVYYLKYDEEEL